MKTMEERRRIAKEHLQWLNDNREAIKECFETVRREGKSAILSDSQKALMGIYYDNHWCGTCATNRDILKK